LSYPLDLDEVPEDQLRAEVERRRQLRIAGLCDYCGRDPNTPTCKFPHRHRRPTRPVEGQQDKDDPLHRLSLWLAKRPMELVELATRLGIPLRQCEGFEGPCENVVLWETPGMTSYEWDGEGVNPNRNRLLCPECSAGYVAHWKDMWDEYRASVL
jgi:hypothetical protein